MVKLKFDYNKLKIKYIFGNYRDIDGYPTTEDTIYSLILWFIGNNKSEEDLVFTDKHATNFLNIKDIDKVKSILNQCVEEGYISHEKDTNTKSVYKLGKNPFI